MYAEGAPIAEFRQRFTRLVPFVPTSSITTLSAGTVVKIAETEVLTTVAPWNFGCYAEAANYVYYGDGPQLCADIFMYGDGRLCLPRQPRSEIDDWVAPYIEVPDSERTEIAERIDAIAILCGVTDPEVVYPSDAMLQALTGQFTAKAWTRFKTATDIYCARNMLTPDPEKSYHLETRFASLGADSQGRCLPGCRISQECLASLSTCTRQIQSIARPIYSGILTCTT